MTVCTPVSGMCRRLLNVSRRTSGPRTDLTTTTAESWSAIDTEKMLVPRVLYRSFRWLNTAWQTSYIDENDGFDLQTTTLYCLTELKLFLGLCNVFRCFVPRFSHIVVPLNCELEKDEYVPFSRLNNT